jgi:hypothetical protein
LPAGLEHLIKATAPHRFHEGFAEFAAWNCCPSRGDEPNGTRTATAVHPLCPVHDSLDTVDEVEQNDKGVSRAQCLLARR